MIDLSFIQKFVTRLSKREKLYFYISVVFVSLAVLVRGIISPALSRIETLKKEIETTKLMIKKDLHFLAQKERIDAAANTLSPYFTKSSSPEVELTSLLKFIDELARQSQVFLLSRKPSGFKSEEMKQQYLVLLDLEGEMPKIVDFLYRIESSQQLLSVEALRFSPKQEGSSIASCRLTIAKTDIP